MLFSGADKLGLPPDLMSDDNARNLLAELVRLMRPGSSLPEAAPTSASASNPTASGSDSSAALSNPTLPRSAPGSGPWAAAAGMHLSLAVVPVWPAVGKRLMHALAHSAAPSP